MNQVTRALEQHARVWPFFVLVRLLCVCLLFSYDKLVGRDDK